MCWKHRVHTLGRGRCGECGSHTWQSSLGKAGAQISRISEGHTRKWADELSFLCRQRQQREWRLISPLRVWESTFHFGGPWTEAYRDSSPKSTLPGKGRERREWHVAEQKDESRQDTVGAYEGPAEAVALGAEVTASGDPRSSWGGGSRQGWDCRAAAASSICLQASTVSSSRQKLAELKQEGLPVNYYKIQAFVWISC